MGETNCIKEEDLGKMSAQIENCLNHVTESNKPGGYRDRVLVLEQTQATFKDTLKILDSHIRQSATRAGIIGGVIGGLIGAASPTTMQALVSIIGRFIK